GAYVQRPGSVHHRETVMEYTAQDIANRSIALSDVDDERDEQDKKWGEQNHLPVVWMSILGEEFGEACQEANRVVFGGKSTSDLRHELIQVAAVAVAAVEYIDRRAQYHQAHGTAEPGQ